jgi:Tol biopolymer transport system component
MHARASSEPERTFADRAKRNSSPECWLAWRVAATRVPYRVGGSGSRLGRVRRLGWLRAAQTATGRVMLGAGLALALAAPTADATFPGRNGRIAFTSFEFSAEDNSYQSWIISIRPDGSAPRVLARGMPEDAAYRSDGHMIAFARPRAGIFLMRSDGSAKRRLLSGSYGEPDWSPDGRRLVVTRTRSPRRLVIWDRGEVRPLTPGSTAAWSPKGKLIAFTRQDLRYLRTSVYVMSSGGCCLRRLAPGDEPEWSPDGRRITFTTGRGGNVLSSIRPDGTGLRRLAPIHGTNPVYAPNGKRVAYMKTIQHSGFSADAVFTMGSDGRRRTRIFDTVGARYGGISVSRLDWQPRPRRAHRP